ncbi:MAG: APC family permease [Burkholderiales bacterium]
MAAAAQSGAPKPTLTLFDAVAIIVGIVIGAGIFRAPSIVAGSVSTEAWFIGLWVAGGVISLVGALCYAELGSAYPHAGGEYHFLSRAFGGPLAFLFAWARMTVVQTGAIAAIAFVFGDYATQLLSLGEKSSVIYALIAVAALTALNVVGTRESKVVQKVLTAALAIAMAAVIIAGFSGQASAPAQAAAAASSGPPFSQLALIFILLTYGGWNEAAYITAEVQDSRRNIVRALVIGILVVTVIYVLLNLAYVNVLGLDGMKASKALAADMMKLTFGGAGAAVLSLIVIAASLSTLNATVFTGARTNYAVGRDYAIFSALGRWKEGTNTPVNALLLQGAIALVLVLLSSFTPDGFETMVAYTAPAFWLFFMLTGISLFILRRQQPAQPNPFRVPLYPFTPILFIAMCAFMLWSSTSYAMSKDPSSIGAQLGISVLLLGIPVMLLARRRLAAE